MSVGPLRPQSGLQAPDQREFREIQPQQTSEDGFHDLGSTHWPATQDDLEGQTPEQEGSSPERNASRREFANKLAEVGITRVSYMTVTLRLAKKGIHGWFPKHKPWLSEQHRTERLHRAKDYAHFTLADWERVLWTVSANLPCLIWP